jgi:gluconolactonase
MKCSLLISMSFVFVASVFARSPQPVAGSLQPVIPSRQPVAGSPRPTASRQPVAGSPQDFSSLKPELVADGFPGGEGPVWSREGFLLFSDYSRDRIYKYVPGGTPEVYREDSHGTNGNAMDAQRRLYSCEYKSRRVTRTDKSGHIEVLAETFEGKRFNAPNDIVVRRDGHIYFTDPLYTPLDHRDLDFFGLYHLTPKGHLETISRTQTRPNGVTLSPNGKILYVADTDQKKILAYDLDRHGRASHPRAIIDSGADGIRTDQRGNLYLASRGVLVYSPQGKLLGKIQPRDNPRNIAFGDSDLRTLYMIGPTLYRVRLDIPGALQY